MKKHLCIGLIVSVLVSASIIIASSEEMDLSSPLIEMYPVLEPFALVEDSIYTFRSGELYRAPFGGTGSLYTGTLTSALNELNVATLDDVQAAAMTIPDMVSALQQYFSSGGSYESFGGNMNLPQQIDSFKSLFGTFPFNYSRRINGSTNTADSIAVTSLSNLIARIGNDLQYDFVSYAGNNLLIQDGSISRSTQTRGIIYVLSDGLIGLAQRLSGQTGSAQFDIFAPGSGTSRQVTSLMDALSAMNTSNISALTMSSGNVLYPDGVTQSITGRLSLANINDYGFQGLATILRGASSNGVGIEWLDYTDLSTSTSGYSYLFELEAAGFQNIQNLLAKYMYSHGTDLDIKERENMQPQADQFVEDFTSPNGKGTMSTDNMSDLANVSSSMGDSFKSDATVSDVFTQLGNGDNYSFFSNAVLSDLEGQVPSTFSNYDDGYIDFLVPHLEQFKEVVGTSW